MFSVGDRVVHKSGGPKMIVAQISPSVYFAHKCRFWSDLRIDFVDKDFHENELDLVSDVL